MKTKEDVVDGTAEVVTWWLTEREKKFAGGLKDTMNVNPFMLPLVSAMHGIDSPDELAEMLLGAHLVGGHNTGFGKLVDEKLLPRVFDTKKLDGAYRSTTPPYSQAAFNDIDHVVPRAGHVDLLSLKSSPWTINLSNARDLNTSFAQIRDHQIEPNPGKYGEIAMGVIYGTAAALTDKYHILRGETAAQRQKHKVVDVTDVVNVYAGRKLWTWINDGEDRTQDWILTGIQNAAASVGAPATRKALIAKFVASQSTLSNFLKADGSIDWHAFLSSVNG